MSIERGKQDIKKGCMAVRSCENEIHRRQYMEHHRKKTNLLANEGSAKVIGRRRGGSTHGERVGDLEVGGQDLGDIATGSIKDMVGQESVYGGDGKKVDRGGQAMNEG